LGLSYSNHASTIAFASALAAMFRGTCKRSRDHIQPSVHSKHYDQGRKKVTVKSLQNYGSLLEKSQKNNGIQYS